MTKTRLSDKSGRSFILFSLFSVLQVVGFGLVWKTLTIKTINFNQFPFGFPFRLVSGPLTWFGKAFIWEPSSFNFPRGGNLRKLPAKNFPFFFQFGN